VRFRADDKDRREEWHRWFAWYPVRIGNQRVWLETVERKGRWWSALYAEGWDWQYREAV
jgi:hypothetical protein